MHGFILRQRTNISTAHKSDLVIFVRSYYGIFYTRVHKFAIPVKQKLSTVTSLVAIANTTTRLNVGEVRIVECFSSFLDEFIDIIRE